ncbi:Rha family transcriptional regulator [Desulfococcaceae bacterium HSG8]|nr:Rha family transcriptional regulator [Desulfococcaceae bacterium HSG8]
MTEAQAGYGDTSDTSDTGNETDSEAGNETDSGSDEAITSTLIISQVFRRRHRDILRDVRRLLERYPDAAEYFSRSTYQDCQGRSQPCYLMNRNGFNIFTLGFSTERDIGWKIIFSTKAIISIRSFLSLKSS